jgi:ferredoxin
MSEDKCKPKKCKLECKRSCPIVLMGKMCIEVSNASKIAAISEDLCIGCGICVKKCPFEAITIINLPRSLARETTHRYGPNTFKLHRLPMPRPNEVLASCRAPRARLWRAAASCDLAPLRPISPLPRCRRAWWAPTASASRRR